MNVVLRTAARATALAAVLAGGVATAEAATVYWADWQTQGANTVGGTIAAPTGNVGVTFSGEYAFAQTGGGGDYWVDYGYTQGVVNRPPGTDIIALAAPGPKVLTFSEAVVDPYIAFVSWNNNFVTVSSPFTEVSQGCGYFGCGTFQEQPGNLSFNTNGEVHGVLQFQGTFTSLSFTPHNYEYWHGFTVGIGAVAPDPVPLPGALPLFASALGLGGFFGWKRKRKAAAATA